MSARQKNLALRIKSAGEPTADQLSLIRQYTLADIPVESLYVRTFVVAHNAIDRDNDAFDSAALGDFAKTLPGKGLFIKHPSGWDGDSGPGEGLWFDAEVQRMSFDQAREMLREPGLKWPPMVTAAELLIGHAYAVRTDENKALLAKVDAGIAGFVSVGFNAKYDGKYRDEAGRELTVNKLTSPAEALEASLVWLGAQPGARAIKNANREEPTMDPKDTEIAGLKTQVGELQQQIEAGKSAKTLLDSVRKALGDNAHMLEKPDELAAAVKAAADLRNGLVDTIVAGERAAGLCGDGEEEVTAAKAIYAGMPLKALQTRAEKYGTAPTAKVTCTQPDPNSHRDDKAGVPAAFAAVA